MHECVAGVFQKIILVPKPDYGTRVMLWKALLFKAGATLTPQLDLSALAKISGWHCFFIIIIIIIILIIIISIIIILIIIIIII
jgi:hypothetical protein